MGTIKDRNGIDLTEAEDIKKRWQEHTEEPLKKIFIIQIITKHHSPRARHTRLLSQVDLLGSIITKKASGSDGIPAELFQILKVDAVKVLHSTCQQIWKTQQWPQDWKRSVFIPIQRKAMPKNAQTTAQLHSSHMLVK